jgi:hypothetical protein
MRVCQYGEDNDHYSLVIFSSVLGFNATLGCSLIVVYPFERPISVLHICQPCGCPRVFGQKMINDESINRQSYGELGNHDFHSNCESKFTLVDKGGMLYHLMWLP